MWPPPSGGACRTRDRRPRSSTSWWAGCGPAWATAARGTSRNYAPAAGSSWSAGRRCRRAILMTSPLRRKRLTTAPGRSTPATTPARLAAAALLLLAGGLARAQEVPPLPPLPPAPPAAWKPTVPEAPALPPAAVAEPHAHHTRAVKPAEAQTPRAGGEVV